MRISKETAYPETPKGERSVKGNIYGNLVGYVSGKRFWEFGDRYSRMNQHEADVWMKGATLEEARLSMPQED